MLAMFFDITANSLNYRDRTYYQILLHYKFNIKIVNTYAIDIHVNKNNEFGIFKANSFKIFSNNSFVST